MVWGRSRQLQPTLIAKNSSTAGLLISEAVLDR